MSHPIELAYRATQYIRTEDYRTHKNGKKKTDSPIERAPRLVQAMSHLGEKGMPLSHAKKRAKKEIQEKKVSQFIDSVQEWSELRDFLDTLALFLKAKIEVKDKKRRQAMRKFIPRSKNRWKAKELVPKAQELAQKIGRQKDINTNKIKKLESRIKGCRDKWEALASLAQYYPLSGVPTDVIDDWVDLLGELHLDTFKQLISYTIVLYRAQSL